MISAPSEMRCRVMPMYLHDQEDAGQHQRDRDRHHQPGAHAEAEEAHAQHDDHRLEQRLGEAADRLLDDRGLVRDQVHADADRQLGHDLAHLAPQVLAELHQVVAAASCAMASPIAGLPSKRNIGCGGST